ncbi:MAG: phosphoribosylamine--glycine ligase [Phycisphaeraceae bacterium]|nr:phosphoribosylamine--glycine ligase [Phycisphaeraceae bacterium]
MTKSTERVNVLLVGGGGREHAIAWKLRQSGRLGQLWLTHPENPGLAELGRAADVPIEYDRPFRLQRFCEKERVGLVIIGPEAPLAAGLADALAAGTGSGDAAPVVFGPGKQAAMLESDKAWAKQLFRAAAIPTAEGRVFSDADAAKEYIRSRESPQVVKAAGLAQGKGVIVPDTADDAVAAIDRIMVRREFGDAGAKVVIEERLRGREASVLALVDGRTIYLLEACQDHKRLGDGDTGPNTGGMGAFCPGGVTDDKVIERVYREILVPTIDTLKRDGIDFRGVLYAGIMLTPAGPKVLEFNTRFGDPECQVLMTRMRADLVDVCLATATRKLDNVSIDWQPAASCCVVLASHGYPDRPRTGVPVEGLADAAEVEGVTVFHSGTRRDEAGRIVTAGGRVLSVTAVGESMEQARQRAYRACDLIRFEGKTYRKDIGADTGR